MKTIENLLLKACGYTIFILGLFYLFGAITGSGEVFIGAKNFLTIALFGLCISFAGLLLTYKKMNIVFRVLIHYLVLLLAFYTVFIVSGNIKAENAGQIFVAAVIFSVFYALMFGFVYIFRLIITKSDNAINDKKQKNTAQKAIKSSYKPLYKSEGDK